jgi:hypothetical protein
VIVCLLSKFMTPATGEDDDDDIDLRPGHGPEPPRGYGVVLSLGITIESCS